MVIINPEEGVRFGVVKSLEDMYREIGCNTIDIASRKVGGKWFDFIVDDEGLLKADPKVSAIYRNEAEGTCEPALVGTLIICSHDDKGNTIDISLDDHLLLCDRIRILVTKNTETGEACETHVIQLDDWRS